MEKENKKISNYENPIAINALKNEWADICNNYLEMFCKKHDIKMEPYKYMWIGGNPGTVAEIADMFVGMEDIRYDIDNNIYEEYFMDWYWHNLDVYELTGHQEMNYESYCKGCPRRYSEEDLQKIRDAQKRVAEAKEALEQELKNLEGK